MSRKKKKIGERKLCLKQTERVAIGKMPFLSYPCSDASNLCRVHALFQSLLATCLRHFFVLRTPVAGVSDEWFCLRCDCTTGSGFLAFGRVVLFMLCPMLCINCF